MIWTSSFYQLNNLPKDIVPIAICGKSPEWYTGFCGSHRICMCDWDNSKEEPMKSCPDYKYDKETEDMYKEYYKNEEV